MAKVIGWLTEALIAAFIVAAYGLAGAFVLLLVVLSARRGRA